MRIAIIGAGQVGTTLGQSWTRAGHQVVYGVRDPSAAKPQAGASVDSVRGAASVGDAVVLVTPWPAVADALAAAGDLGGKPLIDVTNPIGPGFALAHGHTTSGAEHVASLARNARVVKAFHSTGFENMGNPRYGERRLMMPIAGDDPGAVDLAARLATDLGFEVVKLAPLTRARDLEPLAMLWIKLALQWGQGRGVGFAIMRRASGERAPERRKTKNRRTITVVGTGNIGGALVRAWLLVGHDVRLAARDAAASDVRALAELGAKVLPVSGSADGAEVVVFAVPAGAVLDTARSLGSLEGKIVVDCTNAIAKGFTLQYGHTTSWSEEISKALPGAKVVRSFNQQGAEVLQNPLFSGVAATNFVASDFDDARRVTKELAIDVGLDAIEVGPLSSARYLEPLTLLWIAMAQTLGTREFGLSLLRR
jgi:predicted dinucleotide-binding enzyme